jgi:hypothetical protein
MASSQGRLPGNLLTFVPERQLYARETSYHVN